jgi:excisionase family DNA binding protein
MSTRASRDARPEGGESHINAHAPAAIPKERILLISVEQGILLRVEAAAILLGIGRTKTYDLIKSGQIPVVRIGRRTLVCRTDLERFAQARRRQDDVRGSPR